MAGTGTNFEDCRHALVSHVTITSIDRATVTFQVRSESKSGDPDESLLRTFTVALSEVYTGDPAPLPEKPVALTPGATGALYVTREGSQARSSDGFAIYDSGKAVFKWPNCAGVATAIYSELMVVPSSILVRGHLEGEVELVEIELLGDEAAAAQHIAWNGARCIQLHLTDLGARRLQVKSRSMTVGFWPTRIVIQGAPSIDRSVSGEIDLLDSELADRVQHVVFARHGAPITLSLTDDGVAAFHVTPQAVAEHASELDARSQARATSGG